MRSSDERHMSTPQAPAIVKWPRRLSSPMASTEWREGRRMARLIERRAPRRRRPSWRDGGELAGGISVLSLGLTRIERVAEPVSVKPAGPLISAPPTDSPFPVVGCPAITRIGPQVVELLAVSATGKARSRCNGIVPALAYVADSCLGRP